MAFVHYYLCMCIYTGSPRHQCSEVFPRYRNGLTLDFRERRLNFTIILCFLTEIY